MAEFLARYKTKTKRPVRFRARGKAVSFRARRISFRRKRVRF